MDRVQNTDQWSPSIIGQSSQQSTKDGQSKDYHQVDCDGVLVNETEFSWMRKMKIAQGEGLNQFRWSERRQPLKVMEIPRGPDNEPVIWL